MNEADMKRRTKAFGLDIVKLSAGLQGDPAAKIISRQLLRSATSVGANYRAVCRAKSRADFISKLAIVEEEADESAYWLEVLLESGLGAGGRFAELLREANELTAILVASRKTAAAKPVLSIK